MSRRLSVISEVVLPVPGVLVLTPIGLGVALLLLLEDGVVDEGVLEGVALGVGVAPGGFLAGDGV